MSDLYKNVDGVYTPARNFFPITPADTDLTIVPKAIYVGGGGTIVATPNNGGAAVTFTVQAGAILPVRPTRIAAASTATGLVGLY